VSKNLSKLQPTNRHLLVVPHPPKKEEKTTVLLPDDYTTSKEAYTVATVVDVSSDCSEEFRKLKSQISGKREVLIDQSMLETISVKGKNYHFILENYVLGIFRDWGPQ
jgi:co-chaperonin GroES (HSP10)